MDCTIVIEDNLWASTDSGPPGVRALVRDALTYTQKGYIFSNAYKMGYWDGTICLVKKDGRFPVGLVGHVVESLKVSGIQASIEDRRTRPVGDPGLFPSLPTLKLKTYQEEAAGAACATGRGIIHHPVGSGKTIVLLEITRRLGVPALALVHRKDLLYQLAERARDIYHIKAGIVGDGRWEDGEGLTVATFQTIYSRLVNRETNKETAEWLRQFRAVHVDECFPAGTRIRMRRGWVPIECVTPGEEALTYDHRSGQTEWKPVIRHIQQQLDQNLVTVYHSGGRASYKSTADHRVWRNDLGHYAAATQGAELLCLREQIPSHEGPEGSRQTKRLSVMPSLFPKTAGRDFLGDNGADQQVVCVGADARAQSDAPPRNTPESIGDPQTARPQADTAQRERKTSADPARTVGPTSRLADGGHCFDWRQPDKDRGGAPERNTQPLQNRHSPPVVAPGRRDRRGITCPPDSTRTGSKEGTLLRIARVDSVEIYQPTGNGRHTGLCPNGVVYDLETADNHNYFAEGVLVHNCHHVGADTYEYVMQHLSAAYFRFGYSATPTKSGDKGTYLNVMAWTGPVVSYLPSEGGIKAGRLVPADIFLVGPLSGRKPIDLDYQTAYESGITKHQVRNDTIILIVQALRKVGSTLILVERIEHGQLLADALGVPFASGSTPGDKRVDIWEDMRQGHLDCVVASVIADEGLDICNIEHLILAGGGRAPHRVIQRVGRGMRASPGKDRLTVFDFIDAGFYLGRQYRSRRRTYEREKAYQVAEVKTEEIEQWMG